MVMYYFYPPTRNTPPDTYIRLGNIIEEPRFADEALNTTIVQIPPDQIVESKDHDVKLSIQGTKTFGYGIWAGFLMQIFGFGGDIAHEIGSTETETWSCEQVNTLSFRPTKKYIKESIEHSEVVQYIRDNSNWLRDAKLYMITGIKVASGASGTMNYARKKGIHLHLGVDAMQFGPPIEAGPDFGFEKSKNTTQSFGQKDAFVLAFRMQRIKVSSKGKISLKDVEGGFLGVENDDDDGIIEITVDDLEHTDADAAEFGLDGRHARMAGMQEL